MADTKTSIEITVTEDRLRVILKCVVTDESREDLLDQIEEELELFGIADRPNRAELAEILAEAAKQGGSPFERVLVEGTSAAPPKPGRIEWGRDFFSTDFQVDEATGLMDYRVRKGQPAVQEGEFLAHIIAPIRGKAGRDVYGKPITPAEPESLRMGAGLNVRLDEEKREFYSTIAGRVRWSACVLSVDPVLEINGNVGLETGNISHPGALVVKRDIETGAEVKAAGDIEVGGIVEEAQLEGGGNLLVAGGITGSPSRRVKVAGSIVARFILDANILAGEDVVAKREIVHSNIVAKKRVLIPDGRVVGGSICAVGGIEAAQVGSEANVPTLLIAGVDAEAHAAICEKEKQIELHKQNLDKLRTVVPKPTAKPKLLPEEKQKALLVVIQKIEQTQRAVSELESEIAAVRKDLEARSSLRVVIHRVLYPETTIRLGNVQLHVRELYAGPLSATIMKGEVTLMPLTSA